MPSPAAQPFPGEIPPTAGLPLGWRDLLGSWRPDFASEAARYIGVTNAGLTCSGTASLVVILTALKARSTRRSVVVPAYTCPLVAFAILHCGLRVRVCDLAPDSFEFDVDALAAACDGDTLAVMPTHLAGRVADVSRVSVIAHAAGAAVIEDAAQAFGARQGGRSVGLMGDAGFFSFAAGKGLSLYEGGLWIARDESMQAALNTAAPSARNGSLPHRAAMEALRCLQLAGYAAFYRPAGLGLVYGRPLRRALKNGNVIEAVGDDFSQRIPLHGVSAWRQSVGSSALQRLGAFQAALVAQARRRVAALGAIPGVKVFDDAPGAEGVWPSLMLIMPTAAQRDAALQKLWTAGLGVTRMFAHVLPDYPYLSNVLEPAHVPNARDFAARSLSITNSPWLDDARFAHIVSCLRQVV